MKKMFLWFLLLSCSSVFSQRITDTIHSEKLNADRVYTISLPLSYNKDKNKKYPLLFLLDGEYLFDAFDGAFAYGNYWDDLPETIIVGINQNKNNEREADCTMNEDGLPTETGAAFFEFVGAEFIPALEKAYRISPFRIIAGHDLTAGYMNLFLYKENPIFNAYISFSGEFGEEMIERVPAMLSTIKKPVFYYHAAADGDLKFNLKGVKALDDAIKTIQNPNLYYRYDEFKGASHYSVVLYAIPNALYHIFGAYQPISKAEYDDKIATLSGDYVSYLTKKYDIIDKTYGMKMPVRISDFKAIEAAIVKNNAFPEFEKLAAISKKSYPKSMLSQYHMGMYYEKTGDAKKAAKAYQNAYLLDEIGDLTKDMMLEKADMLKSAPKKGTKDVIEEPVSPETPDEEKKP
jgi:uncharacterized protein